MTRIEYASMVRRLQDAVLTRSPKIAHELAWRLSAARPDLQIAVYTEYRIDRIEVRASALASIPSVLWDAADMVVLYYPDGDVRIVKGRIFFDALRAMPGMPGWWGFACDGMVGLMTAITAYAESG